MATIEVVFAALVGVLAGVAVVGALAFCLVWEWAAIRRVLARARKPTPEEVFWQHQQAVTVPERRER